MKHTIKMYSNQDDLLDFHVKQVQDKVLQSNHSWYNVMVSNGFVFFALDYTYHMAKIDKEPLHNEVVGYHYFNVPNTAAHHGYNHLIAQPDKYGYFNKHVKPLLQKI